MNTRALIFAIWIKSGKSLESTVSALESMAAGQVKTFIQGGKTMVSASVGNESFSYQLSGALSADAVTAMCYDAWRRIGRFEDEEKFEEWLKADDCASFRVGFHTMRDL